MFWHLDAYPTRAAAQAAKGAQGAVVQSFGKVSLLTIAEEGWRPQGGERVAQIGPLPVTPGQNYSAQYMEATFTPGMTASEHIHPGPEAWFTLSGETCLETPEGKQVGRAGGQPVIVPGGPPMHLTATGSVSHLMSPLGVERVCFRMARHCNSFKSAFASFRSSVSKPFVNQK